MSCVSGQYALVTEQSHVFAQRSVLLLVSLMRRMELRKGMPTAEGIHVDLTSELCLTVGGFQFCPKWKYTNIPN